MSEIYLQLLKTLLIGIIGTCSVFYLLKTLPVGVTYGGTEEKWDWGPCLLVLLFISTNFFIPVFIGLLAFGNPIFLYTNEHFLLTALSLLGACFLTGTGLYAWNRKQEGRGSVLHTDSSLHKWKIMSGWLLVLIGVFLLALIARLSAESRFSVVVLVLVVPLVEEWLFRGTVYTFLQKYTGNIMSLIGSSLIFSLAHQSYDGLLLRFFLGAFLCFIFERSKQCILVPIAIHSAVNLLGLYARSFF